MSSFLSNVGNGRTAAGTMIGILAIAALESLPKDIPPGFTREKPIRSNGESATVSNLVSSSSLNYSIIDKSLTIEVAEAYERFAASQKPLDPEFARLLSANLWDLYAR